jgi:hypothetical protein
VAWLHSTSERMTFAGTVAAMLKIIRSTKDELVTFKLIGRVEGENLAELKRVIRLETRNHNLILDLKDVTLMNQSAIRFLASCEADTITIENCPAYIHEWIVAENQLNRRR